MVRSLAIAAILFATVFARLAAVSLFVVRAVTAVSHGYFVALHLGAMGVDSLLFHCAGIGTTQRRYGDRQHQGKTKNVQEALHAGTVIVAINLVNQ